VAIAGTSIVAQDQDVYWARHHLLRELRFPRAVLDGLVSFSIGMTVAAMQGLMHNPLIEQGIMVFRERQCSGRC
jgi:ABC-type Fe3+-siderophore transport system permease subunit